MVERETKPPKRYTDATLLSAMKNAGRQIDDDDLAAAMKESGLGTPATRAEMIEKLIRIEVAERQKKSLVPTAKGKALIGAVAPPLKSPELTGQWEQRLKEIEEGKYGAEDFYRSILTFVDELLVQVRQGPALSPADFPDSKQKNGAAKGPQGPPLGPCPLCKEGQISENAKAFGCSRYRQGCKFVIWKTVAGKKISAKQATQLLKEGKTGTLKGFTSKAGKKFSARLKLAPSLRWRSILRRYPRSPANAFGGAGVGAGFNTRGADSVTVDPRGSCLSALWTGRNYRRQARFWLQSLSRWLQLCRLEGSGRQETDRKADWALGS